MYVIVLSRKVDFKDLKGGVSHPSKSRTPRNEQLCLRRCRVVFWLAAMPPENLKSSRLKDTTRSSFLAGAGTPKLHLSQCVPFGLVANQAQPKPAAKQSMRIYGVTSTDALVWGSDGASQDEGNLTVS